MAETKPLCVVAGVGPGNGLAFSRLFAAKGYQVAMLARDKDRLAEYEAGIEGARGFVTDVTRPSELANTFGQIESKMGKSDVLIYNAGSGHWDNVEETSALDMEMSWRTNTLGLLAAAQAVIPGMKARSGGAIMVIGAGAALRGRAKTTAFASAKAAQRSLAQSMARHLGPAGIHVSYVVIDGVIDLPQTRARMPDASDDFFLKPADIATTVYELVGQPKSAWSFEVDLRPFGETW